MSRNFFRSYASRQLTSTDFSYRPCLRPALCELKCPRQINTYVAPTSLTSRDEMKSRTKFAAYEALHSSDSAGVRPPPISVESEFDKFVEQFGGKKISSLLSSKALMPLNADYIFPSHNVIAELKTLSGLFSGQTGFENLKQAFIDAGSSEGQFDAFLFRTGEFPARAKDLVRSRIRRGLEKRIRTARKQLRKSKEMLGNEDTKALIIIAADQPPIFGHHIMITTLAMVMGDNYRDEHTDGVIYMNPNVPTKVSLDGMEFTGWFPFYRDDETNAELSEFVNLLGNRWLTSYASIIDQAHPILELTDFDDMMFILSNGTIEKKS